MGSIGSSTSTSSTYTTDFNQAGKAPTNNVVKTLNYLGLRRDEVGFIDKVTHGYRISVGQQTQEEVRKLANDISSNLGFPVVWRTRGGAGHKAGTWDLIIPFSTEDNKLSYKYKRR